MLTYGALAVIAHRLECMATAQVALAAVAKAENTEPAGLRSALHLVTAANLRIEAETLRLAAAQLGSPTPGGRA